MSLAPVTPAAVPAVAILLALAIGQRLGKPGVYRLLAAGRLATARDTQHAAQRAGGVVAVAAGLLAALSAGGAWRASTVWAAP